jgi:hypothetical protein
MKSRPILFSAPMVRALLAGTKTQTRRLVKPQPPFGCRYLINGANNAALCQSLDNPAVWVPPTPSSGDHRLPCPYGQPGDRLWVKETHRFGIAWDKSKPTEIPTVAAIRYEADGVIRTTGQKLETGKARPSLFMRQAFSRLTLEITEIRVERLHAITEADAISEGIEQRESSAWKNYLFETAHPKRGKAITDEQHRIMGYVDPRESYRSLWEKINGPGSWALNPYVWVLTFRRVTP